MDGHHVEFGFAAKLATDNFFVKFSIKTANIKLKSNKFKTYLLEAN